jgi:hypothetical protein
LALGQASSSELLAVAAVLDEGFFKPGNLLVEQVIGLVNEADGCIGADGWVSVIEPAGIKSPPLLICQASQIRRIVALRDAAYSQRLWEIRRSLRKSAVTEEILIIE